MKLKTKDSLAMAFILFMAPIAIVYLFCTIIGFVFWMNPIPAYIQIHNEIFLSIGYRIWFFFCLIGFISNI